MRPSDNGTAGRGSREDGEKSTRSTWPSPWGVNVSWYPMTCWILKKKNSSTINSFLFISTINTEEYGRPTGLTPRIKSVMWRGRPVLWHSADCWTAHHQPRWTSSQFHRPWDSWTPWLSNPENERKLQLNEWKKSVPKCEEKSYGVEKIRTPDPDMTTGWREVGTRIRVTNLNRQNPMKFAWNKSTKKGRFWREREDFEGKRKILRKKGRFWGEKGRFCGEKYFVCPRQKLWMSSARG